MPIHARWLRTAALLVTAAAALSACESSSLPEVEGEEGALSFDYLGPQSGNFSAAGAAAAEWHTQPFAAAGRTPDGFIEIVAFIPRGENRADRFSIAIPAGEGARTVDIDWSKCIADMPCAGGSASFGLTLANRPSLEGGDTYMFSRGTVHVTSTADGRIRGTFSGRGNRAAGDGQLTYAGGAFDLPLLNGPADPRGR